jgi:hypothetical protein
MNARHLAKMCVGSDAADARGEGALDGCLAVLDVRFDTVRS